MSLKISSSFLRFFSVSEMNGGDQDSFRFNSFVLKTVERQLLRDGEPVALTPKVFDTLVYLVERAGHLVEKQELMAAVWRDSFVEEGNLSRAIYELRRALGQDKNENKFIETVPTKGYRFTMPVVKGSAGGPTAIAERPHENASDRSAAAAAVEPRIQLVKEAGQKRLSKTGFSRRPALIGSLLAILLIPGFFWYGGGTAPFNPGSNEQAPLTNHAGAYRLFLEGKLILDRRYENHPIEALAKFEEAIKLDPDFALAHAAKADAEWRLFIRHTQSHDDIARARASAYKALRLDPNSSYAHTVVCRMQTTFDWDFPAAEKTCRRAVELDPKSHDARHELAMFLTQFARHDEALAEIDAAVALAPTSFNKRNRAVILFHSKRYDLAIKQLEEIKASDPQSPHWLSWLWWVYALNRDYDNALDNYIDWQKRLGRPEAENDLKSIDSALGWAGVLRAMVRHYKPGESGALHSGAMLCQLGEMDETFEALERELKNRTLWLIHLIPDPRFDPCRDDPRFDSILKRVGLK